MSEPKGKGVQVVLHERQIDKLNELAERLSQHLDLEVSKSAVAREAIDALDIEVLIARIAERAGQKIAA